MADFTNIKNFKPEEFNHPDLMDQGLVDKLDLLRDRLGLPIDISSSYRDPDHNASVGGVQDSQHLTGHAVDLILPSDGAYHYQIVKLAYEVGFTGIGERRQTGHAGMLHLDNRSVPSKWTYADPVVG